MRKRILYSKYHRMYLHHVGNLGPDSNGWTNDPISAIAFDEQFDMKELPKSIRESEPEFHVYQIDYRRIQE